MGPTTPHGLRRLLAHGLRLAAATVVASGEGRPAVGGATRPEHAEVLARAALLCRTSGRLLAEDPSLATLEGLGAAQARLGEALTRALDPHAAALAVSTDPRTAAVTIAPYALLGDLDTAHRGVARRLLEIAGADELGDEPDAADRLRSAWLRGLAEGCAAPDVPIGSVLERGADVLGGALRDAESLAAAVLHATDCGLLASRGYRPATTVGDDAEALLGAALAAGRLDLVAGLLCTFPMLGLPLPASARHALGELDRAEAAAGFLPGPGYDPGVAADLTPADRSTYVIRTSGLTAVAGAVLACALLRATAAPAVPAMNAVAHTGRARRGDLTASALAAGADVGDDPAPLVVASDGPWADALRGAPLAERIACTELVLGAELHAAAAGRDAARVELLVGWARDHGWSHLPGVSQGVALCDRVARSVTRPLTLAS